MSVRFGSVDIDEAKRELRRDGQAAEIEPKAFDLLGYLIRHRHRVVSKAELLDQFWPDPNVGEGALTNCIVRVRAAIGSDGDRVVRTFHRRGYQFIAPVVMTAQAEETSTRVFGRDATALVGRENELTRLQQAVAALSTGRGGMILLSGESGIGKTRLAEEAVRHARGAGIEVLVARCSDGAGHFAPWQAIVESYVEGRQAAAIEETMGSVLATIAQIVPSLNATPLSAVPAGETARSRLFDALASFVARAAALRPLMLFFDDLQWADGTSLALVQFVARAVSDAGVLMLLSHRDDDLDANHPVHNMAAALRRLPNSERLALHRLTEIDSQSVLAQLAEGDVPADVSRAVINSAEGNPFFIEESWRYVVQEDLVRRDGRRWVSRLDAARPHYQRLAADDFAALGFSTPAAAVTWMGLIIPLASVGIALGDRAGAQQLYEQMLPFASSFLVFGPGMISLGAAAGYLGGLAVTAGRWKEAIAHFEEAEQISIEMRAWPAIAHLKLAHARALLDRGGTRNRRAARALLDSALTTARDFEMHGLVERIETARRG